LTAVNERSFNDGMARTAGVTPEQTRARLLQAAAAAFQRQGFKGTRVADIARAAGVSNGALYSHFDSKTELLAAALRDHGPNQLAALFLDEPGHSVVDLLVTIGQGLTRRSPDKGSLVIEALVAARRDPDVARTVHEHVGDRCAWLADLIRTGQEEGAVDPDISPEALARYCLMLLFGSVLLPAAGLDPIAPGDWEQLIERLGEALRPAGADRDGGAS